MTWSLFDVTFILDWTSLAVLLIAIVIDILHLVVRDRRCFSILHTLVSIKDVEVKLVQNPSMSRCKTLVFILLNATETVYCIVDFQPMLSLCWLFCTFHAIFHSFVTPPYRLLFFYILQLFVHLWNMALFSATPLSIVHASINLALVTFLVNLPLFSVVPVTSADPNDVSHVQPAYSSPEDNISLWEYLSVSYMQGILSKSITKTLEEADIYSFAPAFLCKNVYYAVCAIQNTTLFRQHLDANALDVFVAVSIQILSGLLDFAEPLLLKSLLELFPLLGGDGDTAKDARHKAYSLILAAFMVRCVAMSGWCAQAWHVRRSYERVRGVMMTQIVHKALLRKHVLDLPGGTKSKEDERSAASIGETVNLVFGDSYAIAQFFWDGIGPTLSAPLEVLIGVGILYSILGVATFASLSVFVLLSILAVPLSRASLAISRKGSAARDRRIAAVSEMLDCIRLLKSFAWEKPWLDKAHAARQAELGYVFQGRVVAALLNLLVLLMPGAMVVAAFFTYTKYLGQPLTVPVAFSAISVYNLLIGPLNKLPESLMYILRTFVSVRRVERFLAEPELDSVVTTPTSGHGPLHIEEATFVWPSAMSASDSDPHQATFSLRVRDFNPPKSGMVLLTGPSASGKSMFFFSLLGETTLSHGHYERGSRAIGFCSQMPYLESKTIRDNILFHTPFQAERYAAVVEACALTRDLTAFVHGDLTQIGERGVSLSGGQRMRVAIARAIYSHASVVLMDDPLAALDVYTAQHVLKHALTGPLMSDRLLIISSHRPTLLKPHATLHYSLQHGMLTRQDVVSLPMTTTTKETFEKDEAPTHQSDDKDGHVELEAETTPHEFMTAETTETGSVKLRIYGTYLKAAGWPIWIAILTLILVIRGFKFGETYVLKLWSEWKPDDASARGLNFWLWVYGATVLGSAAFSFLRIVLGFVASYVAANSLFTRCLERVVAAPFRYFDTVPIGRVLNRLVSDTGVVDSQLSDSIKTFLDTGLAFATALLVIIVLVPPFLPAAILLIAFYWHVAKPYRETSRALRRLENKFRSPLFSILGETIQGLPTIRAFSVSHVYRLEWFSLMDKFQLFDHFYWCAVFWLRMRFDTCSALAMAALKWLCVFYGLEAGWSAFAIVSAQTFVSAIQQLLWQLAQLELDFSSVERIDELLRLEKERSVAGTATHVPPVPAYWPSSSGSIVFDNFEFRYAPHLPPVLKRLSFTIPPGQKLAVVGRTGSGKSSLAMSLLRIAEASSGSITVDGLDISNVPLHELRSRISYTPQEPILFEGTIRDNLDPLGVYEDAECLSVLSQMGLVHVTLSTAVGPGGQNLSAGQRNQVALARALLRRANIFILDESTAALDGDADVQVQKVIRQLQDVIVISVAHRLHTIVDFDAVLVMQHGCIAEHDAPWRLLQDTQGVFYSMCQQTGDFDMLYQRAKQKWESLHL